MFSWANQQLSKLADSVLAPVPENTPSLRYLSACSSGDELTAKACVEEMMTSSGGVTMVIGSPSKGMQAIHYAAFNGMIEVTRTLLLVANVPIDTFDYQGNTPLHHAVLNRDNPLSFIRLLVEEHMASVVVKNAQGQTPYDVATNVNIRSYLLPRQLQQETMTAIQSGGHGLIPGMDMGGYVVVPTAASAPPPPIINSMNPKSNPLLGIPPTTVSSSPSPMMLESSNQPPLEHARYNTASSAPNSANLRYRPDGFHSSSSDVNLQTKYGHVAVPTVVPPPPPPPPAGVSSASTAGVAGLPPPPFSYTATTASSSRSAYPTTSRYLAYDAVTGQSMAVIPNRTQASLLPPQPPNIVPHMFAPPPLHQEPSSLTTMTTDNTRMSVSTMSQQQQQPLSLQAYPSQRANPEEEGEEDAFVS